MMNRVPTITFRLLLPSLFLCSCFAAGPCHKLRSSSPAGMTGANANDPRSKLSPGMYDAGEAAMGIKHVLLLKKPDAFQLGTDDPDNPKVQETLGSFRCRRHVEDAEAVPIGVCSARFCQFGPCVSGQSPVSWETFTASTFLTSPIRRSQIGDFAGVSGRAGRRFGLQESALYVGGDAERQTRLRSAGFSGRGSRRGDEQNRPPAAKKIVSAA